MTKYTARRWFWMGVEIAATIVIMWLYNESDPDIPVGYIP
jgi:hypothetical protein